MTKGDWSEHPRVKAALAKATGPTVEQVLAELNNEPADPHGQPWARDPLVIVHPGEPVPWSRTAPGADGQVHNVKAYRVGKKAMRDTMHAKAVERGWRPCLGAMAAFILCVRTPRSAADREAVAAGAWCRPTMTPDADNLAKLPLDAAKGVLWRDDAQVTDLVAIKRFGAVPYTAAVITPATSLDWPAFQLAMAMLMADHPELGRF